MTLALTIIPLPDMVVAFRPPWLLLFILYLQFFMPSYFNLTLLFFLGLCLDILLSTVIGEHAFALLLTTWFASGKARRFTFFSMGQQMILIVLFCATYQLSLFLTDAFLGYNHGFLQVFGIALLGGFFWLWIRMVFDSIFFVRQKGIG